MPNTAPILAGNHVWYLCMRSGKGSSISSALWLRTVPRLLGTGFAACVGLFVCCGLSALGPALTYDYGWNWAGVYSGSEDRLFNVAYGKLNVVACAPAYSAERDPFIQKISDHLVKVDSDSLWQSYPESSGYACTVSSGFPVHSFQGVYVLKKANQWNWTICTVDKCWIVSQGLGDPNPQLALSVIPYGPLVGGIFANTLIWASPVWIALWLLRVIRAQLRRLRKRCESCGYRLSGRGAAHYCPECGYPQA